MIRIIFLLLLLFLSDSIVVSAQTGYTLLGKVENGEDAVLAYLFYPKQPNEYAVDSCLIKEGRFSFSGAVEYPVMATLILRDCNASTGESPSQVFNFYLENAPIEVSLDRIKVAATVSGSHTHDLHLEFMKTLEPIKEEMNTIQVAYTDASPEQRSSLAFKDSLLVREQNVYKMNAQAITKFVKAHPDDFFSLYLLQTQSDNVPDDESVMELFLGLSNTVRDSSIGKIFDKKLQIQQATSIGSIAPDFEGKDIQGNLVKLSDFRGKYLLLMFWSSDCGHCQDELPNIEKGYKQFAGKNFTILAIAQDALEREKDWAEFVKNKRLPWINMFDERVNGKKKLAQLYNVQRIPSNFLLDTDGRIIAKNLYGKALFDKFKELL